MVTRGNQHTRPTHSPQGSEGPIPEANKIGASTPFDFEGKNLTAYGGLLPVATMLELLVLYIDGVIFGEHHVLGAVGVDAEGRKHVLGLAEGASENQVVATGLLEDLVRRGLKTQRKDLFVIDGSKALPAASDAGFGTERPGHKA